MLLVDAEDVNGVFGPADLIGELEDRAGAFPAAAIVVAPGHDLARTAEERKAADMFLQQRAEAPQVGMRSVAAAVGGASPLASMLDGALGPGRPSPDDAGGPES